MSKIYWTDATGKKWNIKDMSESHINNVLNKLSMQDLMMCVAYYKLAYEKQQSERREKFRREFFDHMPEGMQEEYINAMYDDSDEDDPYIDEQRDANREGFEKMEDDYIKQRMNRKKGG
jgi:hypothetical protein